MKDRGTRYGILIPQSYTKRGKGEQFVYFKCFDKSSSVTQASTNIYQNSQDGEGIL